MASLPGLAHMGRQGFRTGMSLCFGYVREQQGEDRADLLASTYEIAVAGERYALTPLAKPPYDPASRRLRS